MVERALTNVEPRSGLTISAQQRPMWGAGLAHAARVPAPPNPLAPLAAAPPGLAQRSHRPLGAGWETRVPETRTPAGSRDSPGGIACSLFIKEEKMESIHLPLFLKTVQNF